MSTQVISYDSFQAVTFCLANDQKKEEYAIPIEQVREIRSVESITKIPNSKSYVKGIMNLRGQIIPIVDVKDKLGLSTSYDGTSSRQRILVADMSGSLAGLLVDEVDHVIRIQTKDVDEPPQNVLDSNYVKGIVKADKRLIVLLDIAEFLHDSASAVTDAMKGGQQ